MTIHEFMMEGKNAVAAGLRRRGNHDIIVQETEFIKANDELCCGLNLREKGSLVGRTVYLNDLYDRYSAGESLDPLMRELEERCVQSLAVEPPAAALSIETAFKNYKERLSLRPLSIEQNSKKSTKGE